jgi:hypothetical protein
VAAFEVVGQLDPLAAVTDLGGAQRLQVPQPQPGQLPVAEVGVAHRHPVNDLEGQRAGLRSPRGDQPPGRARLVNPGVDEHGQPGVGQQQVEVQAVPALAALRRAVAVVIGGLQDARFRRHR